MSLTLTLGYNTRSEWTAAVLNDFDLFLADHAACERKASGMALSMSAHYPDKPDVVSHMIDLAIEELTHFREVIKLMHARGLHQIPDTKDPYIVALRQTMEQGSQAYFRDRLLLAAIIERRGHERFNLIAQALEPGPLQKFYTAITQSEGRHYELFLNLASQYFSPAVLQTRLNQLLDLEAEIVADLPLRAALH